MNRNSDIEQLSIDRNTDNNKVSAFSGAAKMTSLFLVVMGILFVFPELSQVSQLKLFQLSNQAQASLPTSEIEKSTLKSQVTANEPNVALQAVLLSNKQDIKNESRIVLDASGHIVARRVATVSSRVTGKLNQLHIEEGQRVVKSQILAELDDQQAQISHQLAQAELTAKHANFKELLIVQQEIQQQLTRRLELYKQNLISEQLVDDIRFSAEKISAQLQNKQALITLSEQKVALALYQLNQHKIRAPFDGVVISKNAQVGELISAGSSSGGFIRTGVGTVVDMSSLEIEVEVGESYINRVYAGQRTEATLDAYPNWKIDGEVVAVIPTADRQKASIKVRVKLFNLDPKILPDMGVKVSFLQNNA